MATSGRPRTVAGLEIPKGDDDDPFWSEENQRHLLKSARQIEEGKVVVTTMEELLAMEED